MAFDDNTVSYYAQGDTIRLIELHSEPLVIDVYNDNGTLTDLTGSSAVFHLMEYATQNNVWSKNCEPYFDPKVAPKGVDYPFAVSVPFTSEDTEGLQGHYTGQLELTQYDGTRKIPFQIEIIVSKYAGVSG